VEVVMQGDYGVLKKEPLLLSFELGLSCEPGVNVGVDVAGPSLRVDGGVALVHPSKEGTQVPVAVASRIEGEALIGAGEPSAIPVLTGANASGVQGR
jgi:hypothetical protein